MIAQRHKIYPELELKVKGDLTDIFHTKSGSIVLISTSLLVVVLALYCWTALTRLPPRMKLGGVSVGLATRAEALERFRAQTPTLPTQILLIPQDASATHSASLTQEQLQLRIEPEKVLEEAFGNNVSALQKISRFTSHLLSPKDLNVPVLFDETAIQTAVTAMAEANHRAGHDPNLVLKSSGVASSLIVDRGELGLELDSTASAQLIESQLQERQTSIYLPTHTTGRILTDAESATASERATLLVGKSIRLTAERLQLSLSDKEIIALIDPPDQWNVRSIEALVADWQKQTGTQPQNPELEFDPSTLKVSKFSPPRSGRTIQSEPTKKILLESFAELIEKVEVKQLTKELVLAETPPKTSLAQLNNLGINERIGFGESYYAHSIPNRIHNVAITAQRIDDTIVPPGAEFSFNKTLGDVSAATGYKAAYVIKNGKTELGDGGGVCQVSTTVFRAVLNAGLKVTKRLPHSYRVSYYELDRKPGMDATVYAGDVDFRFINDTPGHILLHTVTDDKNTYMYVELYGTSDGRRTEIVEHKTWDARPAPPAQYFPDPTLPIGKLVQIDWSAPGIRASFTNVIYDAQGTELRRDTYTSNYKPWSAKYLQGAAQ